MHRTEAEWIWAQLAKLDSAALSPLLNVGSSPADFREKVQPYIDSCIFAPLRQRGIVIVHSDIQDAPGVDLVGDLNDEYFISDLASRGFRTVLCCNLLEHVAEPSAIASKLETIIPVDGYIVVTVPNDFPYHPDPIDTMFRPDVRQVAELFPQCRIIVGDVLNCGTGWDYVGRNPFTIISRVTRRLISRKYGGIKGSASFAPWLFRQARQTCALLQRQPSS